MINIILGFVLPALWIFYFLKKDKHPEPFVWLFITFILGITSAFLSYFTEDIVHSFNLNRNIFFLLSAFIEEFFKFLVVWALIFPHKVFDEPVDAMVYMMVSALGFASVENLFYLYNLDGSQFWILFFRFLGANFLHILASALIGYGYGYSMKTKRMFPLFISFASGVILHFLYNFVIITTGGFILVFPFLWSVFLIVLSELDFLVLYHERSRTTTN